MATALVALSLSAAGVAVADDQVPTPWNGIDIGGPSPAGASRADGGVFTLTGGGGLAGTADQFHFVYQSLTGDCVLTARVSAGADPADREAAGVMARQALSADSDFVAVTLTPAQGAASTYRTPYAPQAATERAGAAPPSWVKLVKRDGVVRSYVAADRGGAPGAWTRIGGPQAIPTGMIYVGLCQTGGGAGGTATFDHVSLTTGPQPLIDNGVYTISPFGAPGMVLVAAGGGVKLAPPVDSASQQWRLVGKGGGFYSFQPLSDPSRALTVPGAKSDPGTPVAAAADQGQDTQRWSIVTNRNGTYSLLPQFNTGIGLDDFGGNGTPDAVIDIWSYDGNDPHLQWTINPAQ